MTVVEAADVGVIQHRDCADLALEAVAEALRGDFDGHFTTHPRISSAVHFSHTARADGREDFIGAEFVAYTKRHVLDLR
jgi:hypothetical protein